MPYLPDPYSDRTNNQFKPDAIASSDLGNNVTTKTVNNCKFVLFEDYQIYFFLNATSIKLVMFLRHVRSLKEKRESWSIPLQIQDAPLTYARGSLNLRTDQSFIKT